MLLHYCNSICDSIIEENKKKIITTFSYSDELYFLKDTFPKSIIIPIQIKEKNEYDLFPSEYFTIKNDENINQNIDLFMNCINDELTYIYV